MRPSFTRALVLVAFITAMLPLEALAQDHSEIKTVPQSATQFAVDLYRLMEDGEKNLFFSPHSIYTVLALMCGGAAGKTAEQMAAALHVPLEGEAFQDALAGIQDILNQIQQSGEVKLDIVNSLWPQSGASLKPEFLLLAKRYLAEVYPVDYQTEPAAVSKRINAWAEQETNGRIKDIIGDLHPETHLLLANAIYFKGDWARQFDKAKTSKMPFQLLGGGTVQVPIMMQLGRFPLAQTGLVQILQLPYEGGDLSMTIGEYRILAGRAIRNGCHRVPASIPDNLGIRSCESGSVRTKYCSMNLWLLME